jgi:tetratricopeptide (TPR) repeat protein
MSSKNRFWLSSCAGVFMVWLLFIAVLYPHPGSFEDNLAEFDAFSTSKDLWQEAVLHHKAGNLDRALSMYDRSIELDDESVYPLLYRGKLGYDRGDYDGAIEDFTRALEIDSEFMYALNARSVARFRAGDEKGALADTLLHEQKQPEELSALINRGVMSKLSGNLNEASTLFEELRAQQAGKKNTHALLLENIAVLKFENGDLAGALADYDLFLEENPDFFRGYRVRAKIHAALGNADEARADRLSFLAHQKQYDLVVEELRNGLNEAR